LTFQIEYSPEAISHLRGLTARQRRTVLDHVERRLAQEPLSATRNKKPMRANPLAPWELRVGSLRVYYEASPRLRTVWIRAVGTKQRNHVLIGGEKIEL
jgi:mRNA-degrading endonuclease RelE of RelBE toxin-antitoxin system